MEAACSAALVSARGTRRGGDMLLLQRGVTITRLVWALHKKTLKATAHSLTAACSGLNVYTVKKPGIDHNPHLHLLLTLRQVSTIASSTEEGPEM